MRIILTFLFCCLLQGIFAQEEMEFLAHWKVDSIPGSAAFNNAYNEVWGLVVDDNEYAVIGSTLGTHILDLTDPENPEEIHFIEGGTIGRQIIHRDYHDYKGYLYAVADEGAESTLQIIDISGLPEAIEVVYDSNDLIRRSHNIFIDTTTAKLYSLISGNNRPGDFAPMKIFDISDPVNPSLINSYSFFGGRGVSQVHDAYVRQDTAYLHCGPDGLFVVDFNNTREPYTIGNYEVGELGLFGYNHSGYLSEDGTAYYVADETYEQPLKVLDVRDINNIELSTTVDAGSTSRWTIPHNQVVAGDYLYSAYYYDGLQVFDISDPLMPERVLYYQTTTIPHRDSYEGNWGVYPLLPSGVILASDMQEGLFILQGPDMKDSTSLNVELSKAIEVSITPNPATDYVSVTMPNDHRIEKATMLDIIGNETSIDFQKIGNDIEFDVSTLSTSGLYYIRLYSADKSYYATFVRL